MMSPEVLTAAGFKDAGAELPPLTKPASIWLQMPPLSIWDIVPATSAAFPSRMCTTPLQHCNSRSNSSTGPWSSLVHGSLSWWG